jgi:hypothetical protein
MVSAFLQFVLLAVGGINKTPLSLIREKDDKSIPDIPVSQIFMSFHKPENGQEVMEISQGLAGSCEGRNGPFVPDFMVKPERAVPRRLQGMFSPTNSQIPPASKTCFRSDEKSDALWPLPLL